MPRNLPIFLALFTLLVLAPGARCAFAAEAGDTVAKLQKDVTEFAIGFLNADEEKRTVLATQIPDFLKRVLDAQQKSEMTQEDRATLDGCGDALDKLLLGEALRVSADAD